MVIVIQLIDLLQHHQTSIQRECVKTMQGKKMGRPEEEKRRQKEVGKLILEEETLKY